MIASALREKNLLHIQDVYKWYGPKCVLENIDLSVEEGEFCTLVGPSGCGKSTLFRLILGQEQPTAGEMFIQQKPIGLPDATRGVVYQRYSLFPHLSVLQNVLLGKRLSVSFWEWQKNKREYADEALEYLRRVGLAEHAPKFPHELSGGMQQRVAVLQSLIMKPKILLMDEPFGALDPGTREDIQIFLLELWERFGLTVLFVTHDLEEAIFLGTRLFVLSQYYTDDRGNGPEVKRGARIVADYALSRDKKAHSTQEKADKEFGELIQRIRQEGFDPSYLQHVRDFNLCHVHSFFTPAEGEVA